jgi:hypothetical protein
MTRTTDIFGALALTILTVLALWSSTLAMPSAASPAPAATIPSAMARA